jgi:hypothetical protein
MDVSALRQIKPEYLQDVAQLYDPPPAVRWHSEPSRGTTNRKFVGQNPMFGAEVYYSLPTEAKKATIKIVDVSGRTLREFPARTEAGLHRISWDLRLGGGGAGGRGGGLARGGGGGGGGAAGGGGGGRRGRGGRGAAAAAAADPEQQQQQPQQQQQQAEQNTGGEQQTPPGGTGGETPAFGRGGGGGFGGRGRGGAGTVSAGAYRIVLTVDGKEFAQNLRVENDPIVSDSVAMASNTPDFGEEEEDEDSYFKIDEGDEDQDLDAQEREERELRERNRDRDADRDQVVVLRKSI